MLWRFPDLSAGLSRSGQFVSHEDIPAMLMSWLGGDFRLPTRDALTANDATGTWAFRTADWSLRCDATRPDRELHCELYVHPDDRWEANDVAALCPDVVRELLARRSRPVAAESGSAGAL
jgi:hypothetical protein